MSWETMPVTRKEAQELPSIFIVLGPDSRVFWNAATQQLLHDTAHVELMVDRVQKRIGIRPCSGNADHAIAVHQLNPRTSRHERLPNARWWLDLDPAGMDAAFGHAGITWPEGDKGYMRNAILDGDIVCIDVAELMPQ